MSFQHLSPTGTFKNNHLKANTGTYAARSKILYKKASEQNTNIHQRLTLLLLEPLDVINFLIHKGDFKNRYMVLIMTVQYRSIN